ncbi:MAG: M1 family metallopeptidase, partial [Caldiserica bacterium]|nr:M1 family metallopeptidase [Caldisericota bacterium]
MMLRNTVRILLSIVLVGSIVVLPTQDRKAANAGIKANYTITEYNMKINPNLGDQTVKIDADIAFKANADLTSVNLYYDPIFKIENVEGITGFKQNKDQLTIPINVKAGKSFVLKLHYYALLKGIEYPGRQWNYVGPEGIYLFQWWYPVTQTTITQGYSEVVTMKIEMTILADWTFASYDVVKKTPASDKKYMVHQFEIRDPAFYYHVVAGPYTTFEVKDSETKIKASYFGSKENTEIGKKIADEVFKELKYFESIFGTPAPQSYIIAQMPNQFKQAVGEKGMLFIPGMMFAEYYKKEKEVDKLTKITMVSGVEPQKNIIEEQVRKAAQAAQERHHQEQKDQEKPYGLTNHVQQKILDMARKRLLNGEDADQLKRWFINEGYKRE